MLLESKQNLVNLGFPPLISTLLYEKFGSKAPLIGKWYKEGDHSGKPDWFERMYHGFSKPGIVPMIELYDASSAFLDNRITIERFNEIRDQLGFAAYRPEDPPPNLSYLRARIAEDFFQEVFFRYNLIKDFIEGKVKNLNPYSKLPFETANEKYEEKTTFQDTQPIKSYKNGWRWIDVGKKCYLVGKQMKNCGSVGVMGTDPSRSMLTLFDKNNNPHVVATYSPNEKRLHGIEGQGSQAIKDIYVDYVLDLAQTLGAEIETNNEKSKFLMLKARLNPTSITRIPIRKNDVYNQFFELTLPQGVYYSDGYSLAPKTQVDALKMPKPSDSLHDKLTKVFGHHSKDEIADLNPGFQTVRIQKFLSGSLTMENLRAFIKETVRSSLKSI